MGMTLGQLAVRYGCELRGDPDSGQRDTATLYSAYLRGVDIADRLTRDEVEEIELAAVKAPREIQEPA